MFDLCVKLLGNFSVEVYKQTGRDVGDLALQVDGDLYEEVFHRAIERGYVDKRKLVYIGRRFKLNEACSFSSMSANIGGEYEDAYKLPDKFTVSLPMSSVTFTRKP